MLWSSSQSCSVVICLSGSASALDVNGSSPDVEYVVLGTDNVRTAQEVHLYSIVHHNGGLDYSLVHEHSRPDENVAGLEVDRFPSGHAGPEVTCATSRSFISRSVGPVTVWTLSLSCSDFLVALLRRGC